MYYAPYIANRPIAFDKEPPIIYNPEDLLQTFIPTSLKALVDELGPFQYVYGLLTGNLRHGGRGNDIPADIYGCKRSRNTS